MVEDLRRVLELEIRKGFQDRAVIGGLDKFIWRWALKVEERLNHPQLLHRFHALNLNKPNYASLTTPKRKQWIKEVLSFLEEIENTSPLPISAPGLPSARKAAPKREKMPASSISLSSPLPRLSGFGPTITRKLSRLKVKTIKDLLYFYPRRYLDYSRLKTISQLEPGEEATVFAIVWEARVVMLGGREGTEAVVGDETGNMRVVWFNQPYLAKKLPPNERIVLSGRVSVFKGRKVMESPEWELYDESSELLHTGRLVPVYPLTEGLHPRLLRKLVKQVVDGWADKIYDFLPTQIKERHDLLPLPQAIKEAHFPSSWEALEKSRKRLAFDELFLFQLGILHRKKSWQSELGQALKIDHPLLERVKSSLPFTLTSAQERVLREILADLGKNQPMGRLLQGEVGSGKTVVAAIALIMTASNQRQGAIMAPTEVLAEQHFQTISNLLSGMGRGVGNGPLKLYYDILDRPISLALLIGSLKASVKEEVKRLISLGQVDLVIGTHALIQKEISFPSLTLAVIDEQHRFGVMQRAALRQKGFNPHILVMTATPIPRTLALTIYGDLDVSILDELPPGRQVAETRWLEPEEREIAYEFIRRRVAEGEQAFIICPIIEESEILEVKAAVEEYKRLSQQVFPNLKLGLLHGRMSPSDKDGVMRRFRDGELHILVSTPIVEVGIDVPRATVMLIEGAERFGLAQLHQFRGRISRASNGICFLVAERTSPEARERLSIMEQISDGLLLAEEDLKMRGPGEFLGKRQSGLPDFKMARLSDLEVLETARKEAQNLLQIDAELENFPHLKQELQNIFKNGGEIS